MAAAVLVDHGCEVGLTAATTSFQLEDELFLEERRNVMIGTTYRRRTRQGGADEKAKQEVQGTTSRPLVYCPTGKLRAVDVT
ncbi:hypothetical protein U9M48_013074 [Paspalum notatum var. saurae]|uniref:Uncharacterized protein n=1 Tax=Paspalum notatum var. saurae TaxID=547442 RepID=A0AAQ3SZM4_PASNO